MLTWARGNENAAIYSFALMSLKFANVFASPCARPQSRLGIITGEKGRWIIIVYLFC